MPEGLSLQPLLVDEFLAVIPSGHPLARQDRISRGSFREEPFILTKAGCERMVLDVLADAGVAPSVVHEMTEASSILALVAEGQGLSIMPRLAAGRRPTGTVLRVLGPPAERRLSLATLAARNAPVLRAFRSEAVGGGPPIRPVDG